ncbi:hypothetical protein BPNPMPFG_003462 [Mesorhizobium sp. AR07]|uniref:hypothetical protein n=1 Tax=Mesorhizobium sp. AR07 TaxID=2865838 RepID=UPI00215EAE41|nr:hypothetical protein [Mesorhizobium sp. AR07]UVK41858.1 hypothetical protein BPNPMPFG_003462 [Mesorhizobium sp. AR07]
MLSGLALIDVALACGLGWLLVSRRNLQVQPQQTPHGGTRAARPDAAALPLCRAYVLAGGAVILIGLGLVVHAPTKPDLQAA